MNDDLLKEVKDLNGKDSARTVDESYEGPIVKDHLLVLDGLITRLRAKKIKEVMARLVQSTWDNLAHSPSKTLTFKIGFKEEEPTLIHVIQAKEELA